MMEEDNSSFTLWIIVFGVFWINLKENSGIKKEDRSSGICL
jgi:hypothetical protein